MSAELVERLPYSDLQKLAKEHGLKANRKASILRSNLKKIFKSLSRRVEEGPSLKTPTDRLDALEGILEATSNSVSHTSGPRDEKIPAGTNLNTTYELESPTLPEALFTEKEHEAGAESNGFPPAKRQVVRRVGSGLRVAAHPVKPCERSRPPFASPHYRLKPDAASSPHGSALSDLSNCVAKVNLLRKSLGRSVSSVSVCTKSTHSKGSDSKATSKMGPNIPADSAFARRKAYDLHRRLSRSSSMNTSGVRLSKVTSGVTLKRSSHSPSSNKSTTRHGVTLDADQRRHTYVDTHRGLAINSS